MNKVSLPYVTFEHIEPIVYVYFDKPALIDEKQVLEMIDLRCRMVNFKRHLVLTVFNTAVEFTPQARKTAAVVNNSNNSIAHAVVVKRLGQRLETETYKEIEKPDYPIGVFTEEVEAEKWLLSHIN